MVSFQSLFKVFNNYWKGPNIHDTCVMFFVKSDRVLRIHCYLIGKDHIYSVRNLKVGNTLKHYDWKHLKEFQRVWNPIDIMFSKYTNHPSLDLKETGWKVWSRCGSQILCLAAEQTLARVNGAPKMWLGSIKLPKCGSKTLRRGGSIEINQSIPKHCNWIDCAPNKNKDLRGRSIGLSPHRIVCNQNVWDIDIE